MSVAPPKAETGVVRMPAAVTGEPRTDTCLPARAALFDVNPGDPAAQVAEAVWRADVAAAHELSATRLQPPE